MSESNRLPWSLEVPALPDELMHQLLFRIIISCFANIVDKTTTLKHNTAPRIIFYLVLLLCQLSR